MTKQTTQTTQTTETVTTEQHDVEGFALRRLPILGLPSLIPGVLPVVPSAAVPGEAESEQLRRR